jgi:hypothetical protein
MIEGCYVAFQLRLEEIRRANDCTCLACELIGALDLKFVATSEASSCSRRRPG